MSKVCAALPIQVTDGDGHNNTFACGLIRSKPVLVNQGTHSMISGSYSCNDNDLLITSCSRVEAKVKVKQSSVHKSGWIIKASQAQHTCQSTHTHR